MGKLFARIIVAGMFIVQSPVFSGAVSYPVSEEHRLISEKSYVTAGEAVYLFHSGTPDVQRLIKPNDILVVHGSRHGQTKEVGRLRVMSYLGGNYLKAEVSEGKIRHDDIAMKDGASCLIILDSEILK
jgi:hypothetical protein